MKLQRFFKKPIVFLAGIVAVLMATAATGDEEDKDNPPMMYRVTIQNLAAGQPLSPAVVATHGEEVRLFKVGREASNEVEAIARNGDQMPMFNLLAASGDVFEVVDLGVPLTPAGSITGGFADSLHLVIQGRSGDRMSLASMLVCSNDGLTGLDRAKLPKKGSRVFTLHGFDAGVEDNTELSTDIVDACSDLGPMILTGDPNGNLNGAVDTVPRGVIAVHSGVLGVGDLYRDHQIPAGVAKVTITRISKWGTEFSAPLGGDGEVPMILTDASGEARFKLERKSDDDDDDKKDYEKKGEDDDDDDGEDDDDDEDYGDDGLSFTVNVEHIVGVTEAHIHLGLPDRNGPVVAFLFGPSDPSNRIDDRLAKGVLTEADLVGGPFEDDYAGFLEALGQGELYVNVHSAEFPGGEIRGQIGVRKAIEIDDGDRNRPPNGLITSPVGDVNVEPGESVSFAGMASDPDGDPVTVLWDFGDGGSSTEMAPGDYSYSDAGTYTVTFTATDNKGLSDPTPDTRTITVEAENQPPNGVITAPAGNETITAGGSVAFAGMASDPDGDPVTVLWDFGDGISSTQMSPGNHTYTNAGTFTVMFTATDDKGLADPTPDTRSITVEPVSTAVTLTELQNTLFTPACARCHGGSGPEAGLDLSAGQSHSNLVNVAATTQNGVRVIPFDADNSVLVRFLDDGHRNRPESERLQIRSWIRAGAKDD